MAAINLQNKDHKENQKWNQTLNHQNDSEFRITRPPRHNNRSLASPF